MITNAILNIAKKEIMDNFRNNWIIVLSVIFAILVIITSYFGSQGFNQGWQNLEDTVNSMKGLIILIIPIISLMLGYASIVGEIEKGSMSSLASLSLNRYEIIIGKFIGLGSVISSTIVIGFGVAGIFIIVNVPTDPNYGFFLSFIGTSILMGLAFLSISMFFSTLFKKRSTAMGGAIFLWVFFAILWQIIIFGILFATFMNGAVEQSIPSWFYQVLLINPLMTIFLFGNADAPSVYWMSLSPILWIIIPMILTFWRFNKKDI